MSDDKLKSLTELPLSAPTESAKARALRLSLEAFDAAQAEKLHQSTQGARKPGRLMAILNALRGHWTMDMRIPVGTAAVALLMLPLGYQLYTSTALNPAPAIAERARLEAPTSMAARPENLARPAEPTMAAPAPVPAPQVALEAEAPAEEAAGMSDQVMQRQMQTFAAPPPPPAAAAGAPMTESFIAPSMPSPLVVVPEASTETFADFDEARLKVAAEEPISTFSIDVDTASYSYVRRNLEEGSLPAPEAVRVEEMINYFSYDYPAPANAEMPFRPTVSVYPTPWNAGTRLLHIGIKGYEPAEAQRRPANLTFLIDTSGSMDEADKLPLLKRAFGLLVENLGAEDTVSIVAYAGSAGVVLEPTKASEKARILGALDGLAAGGSTAGAEGIELAYRLAEEARLDNGINRVILATDGDFNVGIADPEQLVRFIAQKRDSGISLSVLGFGRGNLDDATMQALAQNGNGNAAYIDDFREAQKVLVAEGGGTLETIAQDVKIQVEFNPAVVSEYRLIGYETRALNREDFNNDRVDAGEIGAGHTVTAIYEITPVGSAAQAVDPLRYGRPAQPVAAASDEYGFLKLRYKLPGESESRLIELPIGQDLTAASLDAVEADMRFAAAVAAFGQKLRGSDAVADFSYAEIEALARKARGADEDGYRSEFLSLVQLAGSLSR